MYAINRSIILIYIIDFKESGCSSGQMDLSMKDNLKTTIFMGKGFICGLTKEGLRAIGKAIKWTGREFSLGATTEGNYFMRTFMKSDAKNF